MSTGTRIPVPSSTSPAAAPGRATTYARLLPAVLVAAFGLSAVHTVYSSVVGIDDPAFGVDDPAAWAFYVAAFGIAGLSRRGSRPAQAVVLVYLAVLLGVSVFVYPTTFGPEQQTVFGWFENDVYVGLLFVATCLAALRARRVTVTP